MSSRRLQPRGRDVVRVQLLVRRPPAGRHLTRRDWDVLRLDHADRRRAAFKPKLFSLAGSSSSRIAYSAFHRRAGSPADPDGAAMGSWMFDAS